MLVLAALLGACAYDATTSDPVASYRRANPTPIAFEICFNHGCVDHAEIGLEVDEWLAVAALFRDAAPDAATERARIAEAVAMLETIVGERSGTYRDIGGTFAGVGQSYQLDCIDESVNTTTYLMLFHQQELLRWHVFASPATRGYFFDGWPHSTAVVTELASGRRFAVDSWFKPNGEPPHIVPLDEWYAGWNPPSEG